MRARVSPGAWVLAKAKYLSDGFDITSITNPFWILHTFGPFVIPVCRELVFVFIGIIIALFTPTSNCLTHTCIKNALVHFTQLCLWCMNVEFGIILFKADQCLALQLLIDPRFMAFRKFQAYVAKIILGASL